MVNVENLPVFTCERGAQRTRKSVIPRNRSLKTILNSREDGPSIGGFWRSNGQCARPAALNGPAAEVAEGNALVAEAAFPKAAVEAAFPKAAVADQTRKMLPPEKEANAGTTGDFDFDMSDSDSDGHQRDQSSRQQEGFGGSNLCQSPKFQKKQACL